MAYKFQLGSAKLGGAIESTGQLKGASLDASDGNVTNVGELQADILSSDDPNGSLTLQASGNTHMILAGSEVEVRQNLKMSGTNSLFVRETKMDSANAHEFKLDVIDNNPNAQIQFDLNSTRALTVSGSGIVVNSQMSASSISLDSASGIAGTGLVDDGSGRLAASGVPNSSLAFSQVTINAGDGLQGGGAVSLGGNTTIDINVPDFAGTGLQADGQDLRLAPQGNGIAGGGGSVLSVERSGSDADAGIQVSADGIRIHTDISGSKVFHDNITIQGDLFVNGTQTVLNVSTLEIEDHVILVSSGSNAAVAVTNQAGVQFGDSTLTLRLNSNVDGNNTDGFAFSAPVSSSAFMAAEFGTPSWTISETHISGNLPITASSFHGDGSGLTGVSSDTATSLRLAGADNVISSNAAVSSDISLVDTTTGVVTVTMPDITNAEVGRVYVIKDIGGSAATNAITINESAAGHEIDNSNSISIESDRGAVNLLACSSSSPARFFYSIF